MRCIHSTTFTSTVLKEICAAFVYSLKCSKNQRLTLNDEQNNRGGYWLIYWRIHCDQQPWNTKRLMFRISKCNLFFTKLIRPLITVVLSLCKSMTSVNSITVNPACIVILTKTASIKYHLLIIGLLFAIAIPRDLKYRSCVYNEYSRI